MKTIYYTASSLDGFIADKRNSLEWLFQFDSPAAAPDEAKAVDSGGPGAEFEEFIAGVGAMAMGSTTYQWILDYEPKEGQPSAWPYKEPTWVFSSRSLPPFPGADIRFVRGDVGAVHREMAEAAGGKNIWIVGGGDLAGQFHDLGLLDELVVTVVPVILGGGAPLLPRAIVTPPMRLESVRPIGGAFVEMRLAVQRANP